MTPPLPTERPTDDELVEIGYEEGDEPDYFAQVMYYVLDMPGLNRIAKDAYVCLVRGLGFGRGKKGGKKTRAQLAAVMSISTDTLDRGIKELVKHKIVEVLRRRDPSTGNWAISSYLLKDTKSARLRARIVDLEQALDNRTPTGEAKPQVSTSPQIAARTEEDKPDGEQGHQSAICGLVVTCEDTPSSQVETSPQIADPPVRNLRTRQSADCGHLRESSLKEIEEKREENPPVAAVGSPTVRTARRAATPAPPAHPDDLRAKTLLAQIPRYRACPRNIRPTYLVLPVAQALERHSAPAILRAIRTTIAQNEFLEHQHAPELRFALARLDRDAALGEPCEACQRSRRACTCEVPEVDRPWTDEDKAARERMLAWFAQTERDAS